MPVFAGLPGSQLLFGREHMCLRLPRNGMMSIDAFGALFVGRSRVISTIHHPLFFYYSESIPKASADGELEFFVINAYFC